MTQMTPPGPLQIAWRDQAPLIPGQRVDVHHGDLLVLMCGSPIERLRDGESYTCPRGLHDGEGGHAAIQLLALETSDVSVTEGYLESAATDAAILTQRRVLRHLRTSLKLPAHGDRLLSESAPWVGRFTAQAYAVIPRQRVELPLQHTPWFNYAFVIVMHMQDTGPRAGRTSFSYRQLLVSVPTLVPWRVHITSAFCDSPAGLILGRVVAGHPFRLVHFLDTHGDEDDDWVAVFPARRDGTHRLAFRAPRHDLRPPPGPGLLARAVGATGLADAEPVARSLRALLDSRLSRLNWPHSSVRIRKTDSLRPKGANRTDAGAHLTTSRVERIPEPTLEVDPSLLDVRHVLRGWAVHGAFEMQSNGSRRARRRKT